MMEPKPKGDKDDQRRCSSVHLPLSHTKGEMTGSSPHSQLYWQDIKVILASAKKGKKGREEDQREGRTLEGSSGKAGNCAEVFL